MSTHGRTDGGERFQVLERGYDTRGGEYSATVRYGAHVAQVSVTQYRGEWVLGGHVTHSGYCFQERTYTRRADALRAMPRYVARSLADLETKHGEQALYATCMHEQCSRLAPDGLRCGAHGGEYTPREQAAREQAARYEAIRPRLLAAGYHALDTHARSQERRAAEAEARNADAAVLAMYADEKMWTVDKLEAREAIRAASYAAHARLMKLHADGASGGAL